MGYVEKNLLSGETVEYRARLHPVIFLQPAFFATLAVALLIYGLASQPPMVPVWGAGAVLLLCAAVLGIDRLVHYLTAEFAITNKRVLIKTGFIHRHTLEMLLTKVETIRVSQSIAGRVFNFGTIVVTGTGGTNEPFKAIADPLEFRRQVQARAAG